MTTINNIKLEDDTATVPLVEKNGYYIVGDKNFNFKWHALIHASKTKQEVRWEFNSEKLQAIDWRTPLNVDIRTLYKIRAQQLRDKYNYLILSFSGGSDSTTILQSFLKNNIHLDEIICDWPFKHTNNWQVSRDPSAANHVSEWELAVKPMLEHVRIHHPKIKITITDTTENLTIEDPEHIFTISHVGAYPSTKRYKNVAKRFAEVNEKIDNAAVILGTDKPYVLIERNVFSVLVCDRGCFFKTSQVPNNVQVEYFYSTGDMPELIREQAHLIYQHVLANPNLQGYLAPNAGGGNIRDNIIKQIIYPDWDFNIFQANKGNSWMYNPQYNWFTQQKTMARDAWQSTLNSYANLIDHKYFVFHPNSMVIHNLKEFYSKNFAIGIVPKL